MEAVAKLSLIQQLGVVPVCARWASGMPSVEDEPELAVKYARCVALRCAALGGATACTGRGR